MDSRLYRCYKTCYHPSLGLSQQQDISGAPLLRQTEHYLSVLTELALRTLGRILKIFYYCSIIIMIIFSNTLNRKLITINVCVKCVLTFWHRSFTFNSSISPTWCNNFSVYYPDVCLQLNMFWAFSRPSSGAQWPQWQPLVRSWSGRLARPWTQHDCHHDTKVKPDGATAVIKLLMMGGKTPETCWAVNKRQDNKLNNCCIWLVIYLNCTMMHELTNLKFHI
jgi:hypothetical protein